MDQPRLAHRCGEVRRALFQGPIDCFHERSEVIRAVVPLTVDEEGWGSVHTAAHAAAEIRFYAGFKLLRLQGLEQLGGRKMQLLCQLWQKFVIAQARLVFKEQVVHSPKFTVRSGEFRGLGRRLCKWMHLGQGKVAEYKR
jgi:hypothetical protein